jgi:hypothetical protein
VVNDKHPMTVAQYKHMVKVIQHLSDSIRAHPGMDHNFANRLSLIAEELVADSVRAHPDEFAS